MRARRIVSALWLAVAAQTSGCSMLIGLWSGGAPTRHACVVTAQCDSEHVSVTDSSLCIPHDDDEQTEASLSAQALGGLTERKCQEPRVWTTCYDDLTPCDPPESTSGSPGA